jgi:signal transduction histidine kinase
MRKILFLFLISFLGNHSLYSVNDSIISLLPDTFNSKISSHYIDLTSQNLDKGNLELAKYLIDKGIEKGGKENDKHLVNILTYYMADYFYYKQDYKQADAIYRKVLSGFEEMRDTLMISKTLNSIGLIYSFQNDRENTLKYYLLDIELLDKVQNKNKKIATEKIVVLTNIINLYRTSKQYHEVIKLASKAIDLAIEMNDSVRLASMLNSLGMAYKNTNQFDKSIENFYRAQSIFEKLGDEFRKAYVFLNIGGLYEFKFQSDSALKYYKLSSDMFHNEGYVYGFVMAETGIASIYTQLGKFDSAKKLLYNSIDTSTVYHFNDILLDSYSSLADLEYKSGNYKNAYDFKLKYNSLNDSLYSIEKDKQFAELQTKFETIQKENEINLLKSEKLIRDGELRRNIFIKWTGLGVILILLIFFYIGIVFYNQKKKANILLTGKNNQIELKNKQLSDMNQHISQMNEKLQISQVELSNANNAKNRFFSILAHDLRNPFHAIIGLSYLLSKSYDRLSPDERRHYASDILSSCEQVNRLLENLLEWARTQTNSIEFQPKEFDFKDLVLNSLSVLKNSSDEKLIKIENMIDQPILISADYAMLDTIVRNLVNNSIKFTPRGGSITISSFIEKEKLITSICDTGIGIEKSDLEKLFKIDSHVKTRGTNNENGTGLGLVICKEFINYHHGEIWAESKPGKGSVFHFSIPVA